MKKWIHASRWVGFSALAAACSGGPLQVAPDGRTFVTDKGEPFFWLGDTAWELFHRLDREEAVFYLGRRADQGFNVIQAVVLAESDGLRTPNRYGAVPFHDLDPRRPNESYFEHVDFIVQEAAQRGFQVALLPTWGDKVPSERGGHGPVVFDVENAADYGRFLGERYREAPVVWMLGGDRPVDSEEAREIWRAMARGLREGHGGAQLMSYHPAGEETSAEWFADDDWLDFHVYQSGHAKRFHPVQRYAEALAQLQPRKPYLDAEPPYEDIPIRFWDYIDWTGPQTVPPGVIDERGMLAKPEHFARGLIDDYDVRVHGYWNLLVGGAGFTYGHNAVWQMHRAGQRAAIPCLQDWGAALERPGAQQMQHLRTLFERRSFTRLQPDQTIVAEENPEGPRHVRAALDKRREFALVYLAVARPIELAMGKVRGAEVNASWFDPRSGNVVGSQRRANDGTQSFTPPTTGERTDWVLVLDAVGAKLPSLSATNE